jgi:tRNA threonylcarbamoyladenosine biosynthesis protein TsaE
VIRALTRSVEDTRALAAAVSSLLRPGDLVLLSGDLGTGKTAFAQGLATGLGISERVTSPAFVLARTYTGRLPLVHIDVYRLDHVQELIDMGIAEIVDSGGVTLIEWGEVVRPVVPPDLLEVWLEEGVSDDERSITLTPVGSSWLARAKALQHAVAGWVTAGPLSC